ncbi:hypothetical protein CI109_106358 [Kwoniella shandongensis]|uniref:Conserved oligomeric Golgi complex subunit 7 n=1 Tax=Kwoniella shandongensis TaxID=1734106 RepID=A0A5M6BSD1_9TREE|nr:uncharacterized protein CI109_005937 [Kwoniella shandongensis]KAA5525774.1 hypothetical protein CI109_005937 [Kwoniella shandongensis]
MSSPPLSPPSQPSALSTLATSLDAHTSIPSFLNSLLAPLLPPALAPSQPPQPPELGPIDKQLNELLTQLSLLSQDTSSALEQSIHDISRTVPRLAYDLQFMRESANGLQASLGIVQDRVARQTDLTSNGSGSDSVSGTGTGIGGESEGSKTYRSLEKLTHLDKLKTRLESARDILREAESWSTLESELTTLIANSEWTKAGQRLHEASRSMVVFQNTPTEYDDRKRLLVSLQNELETSVSKALKESLEKGGAEGTAECARFWDVFVDMDREEEFRGYYFKARRADLLSDWKDTLITETLPTARNTPIIDGTTQPSIRFTTFLPRFYTNILNTLNVEVEQIPLIFPPQSAPSILATFLQTTFDALDPSFASRLSAVVEYHGSEALPELIRAFRATEELSVAVQGLLDRMTFNTQGGLLSGSNSAPATATSPTTIAANGTSPGVSGPSPSGMARTSSKRLSISSRRFSRAPTSYSDPTPVGTGWETTLYEPFLDLQSTYATLERRYLESVLRSDPALQSRASSGKDEARALLDRTTALFAKADEAIVRCHTFTHGYGSLGLLSALEAYVSTFLDNEQKAMLDMAKSQDGTGKSKERDELDFDGLDYSTEDWGSFQMGLHILESCRDVAGKLEAFEKRLRSGLSGVETVLKAKSGEGYKITETTWGAILLLQQSTLNSADLHALISNPPSPILPISKNRLETFTRSAQLYLQSIILAPLIAQLDTYQTLGIWSKPDKAPRKGELQVPTFSLSPTDVISKVSEGLLDLLRVFEVWSAESGLGWSLSTLPFIQLPPPNANAQADGESSPPPETVLSTWISSLALTLLSHLTTTTLPSIRNLSNTGQQQLKTDIGYLSNAVRALDVEWEELARWERAVGLDESAWRKAERESEAEEGTVIRRVARMRGWTERSGA